MVAPLRQKSGSACSVLTSRWVKTGCWLITLAALLKIFVGQTYNRTNLETSLVVNSKQRLIWVKESYLEYLRTLGPIPRKVHIFFPDKKFLEHTEFPMIKNGVRALVDQNPGWKLRIYDDADIDSLIANATDLLPEQERGILLGSNGQGAAHIVEKTDIARLIVMYNEGGLYTDYDRAFNIPLDQVLRSGPGASLCLPTFHDKDFMQALMCSAPKNYLFKETINRATEKRLKGGPNNTPMERRRGWLRRDDLLSLGPPTYNAAVSYVVFDGPLLMKSGEPQASPNHMALARAAIDDTNGVIVTKLDTGCDGLLSNSSNGCPRVNKAEVQQFFGMQEWSPQIRKHWGEKWYNKGVFFWI